MPVPPHGDETITGLRWKRHLLTSSNVGPVCRNLHPGKGIS